VKEQFRKRDHLLRSLAALSARMIQGSLVTLRGPCGKASCACARIQARHHQRHYLSWTEAGRTRMLYIPQAQLKGFQRGVRAWVEFKRLAQELARQNARLLKSQESQIP